MEALDEILNLNDPQKIEVLRFSPCIEDNELNQAAYALLTQRYQLNPYKPKLFPLASGAIPLFRKAFFSWQALPHPLEHAQLGTLLLQIQDEEMQQMARRMALFQDATLDHQKKPIYSLMQQEGRISHQEANSNFFEAVQHTPVDNLHFVDTTFGMISKRSTNASVVCIASGCKSGMGSFFFHDAGILNFGPQLQPLGDCANFGLATRAKNLCILEEADRFSLTFQNRLASLNTRQTGVSNFQDSGYSGEWLEAEMAGDLNTISINVHFDGFLPLNKILFSFFGKATGCLVAGSHKLSPRSLDRYQGPAQILNFLGKKGAVSIEALEGVAEMQVIPLAGDTNFWGADFLVGYTLSASAVTFVLKNNS